MEAADQSADVEVVQAPEAPETEQEQLDQTDESQTEGESQEEGDDSEEVEHDGEKYRIPKKLKDAFMKNADYTQKTQTLAEQRREFEASQERLQQEQQNLSRDREIAQAFRKEYAKLDSIENELQQYQGVNWQQLDPQVAQQHFIRFQQLKDAREQIVGGISQAEQRMAQETQHKAAERIQQAEAVLAREIKDWSPTKKAELRDYGRSVGLTDYQLNNTSSHVPVLLLHKAMQWDRHVAEATKKPAAPPAKPLQVVRSGSGAATDPNRLSADEWAKRRNAELAKRNRRS